VLPQLISPISMKLSNTSAYDSHTSLSFGPLPLTRFSILQSQLGSSLFQKQSFSENLVKEGYVDKLITLQEYVDGLSDEDASKIYIIFKDLGSPRCFRSPIGEHEIDLMLLVMLNSVTMIEKLCHQNCYLQFFGALESTFLSLLY